MKFNVLWMAGLMLAATAGQVQGAFVSGYHETVGGKVVNLGGLNWMK
jgi:hypothetical protein